MSNCDDDIHIFVTKSELGVTPMELESNQRRLKQEGDAMQMEAAIKLESKQMTFKEGRTMLL